MKEIKIRKARQNNLKALDLNIPLGSFTVVCGLSGSGKSSLAFETLYAESQKRYLQNTSSYIKQYIDKQSHPDVDSIDNLPPALALEQKNNIYSRRSTVASLSGLSDHLRLLFERLGQASCPKHHVPLVKSSPASIAEELLKNHLKSRMYLLAPFSLDKKVTPSEFLQDLRKQGFSKLLFMGKTSKSPEILEIASKKTLRRREGFILVDRFVVEKKEKGRMMDSLGQGFLKSDRLALLPLGKKIIWFSKKHICPHCFFEFPMPIISSLFSYNSPLGACEQCQGYGNLLDYDIKKIIPNSKLSIKQGCVHAFQTSLTRRLKTKLLDYCEKQKIDITKAWCNLTPVQQKNIWEGDASFEGVLGLFKILERKRYKMFVRILLARYRSPFLCQSCKGSRLKKETSYVLMKGHNYQSYMCMSVKKIKQVFDKIVFTKSDQAQAKESIESLSKNLTYLQDVGLSYLRLDREIHTLSGGELQRLNLSKQLGMELSQVLYILDEPTVGLHPRDTMRMIGILKRIQKLGNTVLVVEHDQDVINTSSFLIEMGPESGHRGGEVIWSGNRKDFSKSKKSNTLPYLQRTGIIPRNPRETCMDSYKFILKLEGCEGHNLKNVTLQLPLNRFVVVTGVSGSGKSSLIEKTLYPSLRNTLYGELNSVLKYKRLSGKNFLKDVILMDQSGVGKTARSFILSYIKAYDPVRKLLAQTEDARKNQLTASHFSLNVEGGRCQTCKGLGVQEIDMVFMDSIKIVCETCKGQKFQKKVLGVRYNGKNILDILNLTIGEAVDFFRTEAPLLRAFYSLQEVGLSYLSLGQSTGSLSGGEKQRLKLARELLKSQQQKTLYILDEPTKGLHFKEIELLLKVLQRLIDNGGSVLVIEHNLEVIKDADYIIDLGPEAGEEGGHIIGQGKPEEFCMQKSSFTASHLQQYLRGYKRV